MTLSKNSVSITNGADVVMTFTSGSVVTRSLDKSEIKNTFGMTTMNTKFKRQVLSTKKELKKTKL